MKRGRDTRACFLVLLLTGVLFFGAGSTVLSGKEIAEPSQPEAGKVVQLEQLLERALKANRFLRQNALQVLGSQYTRQSAESDFDWKLFPSADIGVTRSNTVTEQTRGLSGKISKKNSLGIEVSVTPSIWYRENSGSTTGVAASLSVPLLRGFGKEYTLDTLYAAQYAIDTSTRTMYISQVQIILDTVNLVYEIIKQRGFIDLYSLQEKRLQGHVATAGIMETSGLSTPIDTYRASLGLHDVQQQLSVAREKYLASLERLKNLLAYPPDEYLEIDAPLTFTPTTIAEDKAIAIALDNRIELEQSKADLDEAARKSRVAEKGLLPDLKLVASYHNNYLSDDFSDFSSDSDEFWSIGISSSTDFSRTREKAAFQQSLLEVRKKKLQYQSREDEILSEVKKQLDALHKGEQRIRIRKEQIVQAKGKMRLAEIKFSHGMGNNFDLIESETELQGAETNLLTEKSNYIVGQYRLRAALGTLIAR